MAINHFYMGNIIAANIIMPQAFIFIIVMLIYVLKAFFLMI